MSTEAAAATAGTATAGGLDLDTAWELDPLVSVRPERFGALLYHHGTRRLSFLKSPAMLAVVNSLAGQPSARAACSAAGVTETQLPRYRQALATLAASRMIRERRAPGEPASPAGRDEAGGRGR